MARLAVEQRGDGPKTAWLLHGLGASRDHLHAVADLLGDRFTCLLPDLRGHGDAEGGPVAAIGDFAADLVPLLADRPGSVGGLSLGALVAVEAWQRVPEAVSAVALVDPMLDAGPLWSWATEDTETTREAYRKVIAPYREPDLDRLVALMGWYPLTSDLAEEHRRRNARSHLAADKDTIHSALAVMRRDAAPIAWERPAGSDARVTIVRATRSIACPPEAAEATAALLGAEVAEVESGHCASLDEPERLAAVLAAAFSRH